MHKPNLSFSLSLLHTDTHTPLSLSLTLPLCLSYLCEKTNIVDKSFFTFGIAQSYYKVYSKLTSKIWERERERERERNNNNWQARITCLLCTPKIATVKQFHTITLNATMINIKDDWLKAGHHGPVGLCTYKIPEGRGFESRLPPGPTDSIFPS